MSNPRTSGPIGDGSKSLAPESKAGLSVGFLVTVLLQILGAGLANLDTSGWTGWWVPLVTTGIGTVVGLITAYLKKNR